MGSGEPLANYKRILEAVHRICDPAPDGLGISQRHVTVSTTHGQEIAAACGQLAAED